MKRMVLVLALGACTPDAPAPAPTEVAPPPPTTLAPPTPPSTRPAPATGVLGGLTGGSADLGGGLEGDVLGGVAGGVGGWGGVVAPDPTGAPTLGSCFPAELDGLPAVSMPAGFGDDLFARAYVERRPGGRSINVNVWDGDELDGELTQFPVLGDEDAERQGAGIVRTGGVHEGHPSEADWEDLSAGDHRDTFTVRVSETRLVSLRVQPATTRGEAARIFRALPLDCLVRAE
ncbi:MAG: hypothetical protein U0234_18870 [Sandaracinus sp.]